jgi:TIGR03009 family protein
MRPYWLALLGLALGTLVLHAQQTAPPAQSPGASGFPPPAQAAPPSRLDQLMLRWEKEMESVQTLSADLTRKTVDKVWGNTEEFVGKARYMKPSMAVLEMHKKGNPNFFEKYLCTGAFLYQWSPANKVINVFELPPPRPGQAAQNDFLSFFFGMKADEAAKRYDLKLLKEDQHYIYVEILPKLPTDKADFTRARLVLNQHNCLPRQVWFEQPNGNEVYWDLPQVARDVPLERRDFAPPAQLPPDWNMVRVPRADSPPQREPEIKPSKVRPNDR